MSTPPALRHLVPSKRPHKFARKRLEAWRFAPATPRGRSAHADRQPKTPDAVLNSVDAQVFTLNDVKRALFIVRPPPTVLPPSHPYPTTPVASTSTAPSLSHPMSGPLGARVAQLPQPALRRPTSEQDTPPIGVSRRFGEARVQLSPEETAELRALRLSDPNLSRNQLAERFDCHPEVIAYLQYDPRDPKSMALCRQKMAGRRVRPSQVAEASLNRRGELSLGRQLTLAERQWRRSLW